MNYCEYCEAPIVDGRTRPRAYCSDACRQAAYRARKAASDRRGAGNGRRSRTSTEQAENTPAEASGGISKSEIRNAAYCDTQSFVTTLPGVDGGGFWLWVDPRREAGYDQKGFDLEQFLSRAVALFRTKDRWKGQVPDTVRAHPQLVENGLKETAGALGLRALPDVLVAPETYWLGIRGVDDGRSS